MNKVNHSRAFKIIERWGVRKDCLIEMLHDIQDECNYLPKDILMEVSQKLEIPLARMNATIYQRIF